MNPSTHYLVIDYDYEQTSVYGIYDTLDEARSAIEATWREHCSNRKSYRPEVEAWDGGALTGRWRFDDGDTLARVAD